jgi:hypothetical protein
MRLREEVIDFARVRRGDRAGREKLAKRIFALWQPIFSHLDNADYAFHLRKHVEDESAAQIRGIFGVDQDGNDQALMIVRVHEHEIDGALFARLTINAGFSASMVQSQFGQDFLAWEAWRYRLAHPLRRFFIVDCAVSPASYCAYEKTYIGFAPTRERPILAEWWPLAEIGARALGGVSVEGARREVMRFDGVVRDTSARRASSERSRRAAQFYQEITQGHPSSGVLVMAPLDFVSYAHTSLRYLWRRLRGTAKSGR